MSFVVDKNDLTKEQRDLIREKCNVSIYNKFSDQETDMCVFNVIDDNVHIPLSLWSDVCKEFPNNKPSKKFKTSFKGNFIDNEKKDQTKIFEETIEKLKKDHFCLLEVSTGVGKCFLTIATICHLKLKFLILCHFSSVHEHWVEDFQVFSDVEPQIVKSLPNKKKNGYIMGVMKAQNLLDSNPNIFDDIDVVVVDECQAVADQTSKVLLKLKPKYLIGLSATPDRKDQLHKLLIPFFGDFDNNIYRFIIKAFTVYKTYTAIKPEVVRVYNKMRRQKIVEWSTVVRSLSHNNKRQEFIVELCKRHPNEKIVILSKRVCECIGCDNHPDCKNYKKKIPLFEKSKGIYNILKEMGESVDYLVGQKKKYDKDARILMGGIGKIGVGFNDTSFKVLILASDVIDVRQNEGRVRPENCVIYDLVDDYSVLEKHWSEREWWYTRRKAVIKTLNTDGTEIDDVVIDDGKQEVDEKYKESFTTRPKGELPRQRLLKPNI